MKALPRKTKKEGRLQTIDGSVPRIVNKNPECRFANRCPYAVEKCFNETPKQIAVSKTHKYRCFLTEDQAAEVSSMEKMVEIKHLKKYFKMSKGLLGQDKDRRQIQAVDDVSLTIDEGEIVGLVGESGKRKNNISQSAAQSFANDRRQCDD